jgi:hypothetical protein
VTAIPYQDAIDDRADVLAGHGLNGLRLALVSLPPGPAPSHATLEVHFHGDLHVADILAEITATPALASQIFRVRGGVRILAGSASGQIRATAVAAHTAESLLVTVAPVGDYSTYTLELVWDVTRIDPFFATLPFKFRPGCFTNDCAPPWASAPPPAPTPVIDYLAKDYDSFRHTLMSAMMQSVPGWQSTSEADFDQVLIDLFAAAADELSDYQDRVMNEAYLATTRSRVSLARHARLVDYHVHQGNQASTWLALTLDAATAPFTLPEELVVWTGASAPLPESVFFATHELRKQPSERQLLDPLLNRLRLHTWRTAQPALRAGSTEADLVPDVPGAAQPEADRVRDLIRAGTMPYLLIAERLNPRTGREPGRDPRKRQLLHLIGGDDGAETIHDPVTNTWLVRVRWREPDQLRFDYSFTAICAGTPVEDVSIFHGNLLQVHGGLPMTAHFHEPGADLSAVPADEIERHHFFTRMNRYGDDRDFALAHLPEGPLAYLPTPVGGEVPPRSTLRVQVETDGTTDEWDEVITLVHSDDSAEQGDHFMVETDERRESTLRFGNGVNGRQLPEGAVVHCEYQVGGGASGNVGTDSLVHFAPLSGPLAAAVAASWNPFDVTDGIDPEPFARILRNAPEAYRARQLRAVTLADYVRRAEEVDGVSCAAARYAWPGSWRTVRIVIDPVGTTILEEPLRLAVAAHLESVRLIGEDIELRPPRYVPLDIRIVVCADDAYWPEDLQFVLEQEFSDGWTPDGRRGFFHPDEWTFGEALHRSALAGRVHRVAGIAHIVSITMKRFNAPTPGTPNPEALEMHFDEIVQVANDPDHLERGFIRFEVKGGRQ